MVFGAARLEGVKTFLLTEWSKKGSRVGLVLLRMHKKKPIYRIFTFCPRHPQHLPSASQEPKELATNIFNDGHNLELLPDTSQLQAYYFDWQQYTSEQTTKSVVFQIFCGFILFIYQFIFALLLERSGGICKLESLAAFVNEILLSSCSALFFLERHTLSHCPDTIVTGGEEEV